ncbi:DDE superfamily endonuclease [Nitzschia inconspicua]|uniref:DDE superfamily endonuclease n=1 Tax=Nitzschia inconspicua TaxID=303405 RepID=A0A9K3KI81_9STRA|nr:DDE superfamily endonuclease [Nitzschia inconspicua]
MGRQSINNGHKLTILRDLEERLHNGESLKSVARSHGVDPSQLRKWRKNREKLEMSSKGNKSLGKGKKSSITHLEELIIGWAHELREVGIGISYCRLQVRACQVDENFRSKPKVQQYHMIRRLCMSNGLVVRRGTNVAKDPPQQAIDQAREWLQEIRPVISVPNLAQKYIINMDQTPLPFSLAGQSTLELRGTRSVTVRHSCNNKTRATASLAVAADGSKLKPMIIFKGEPRGTIATRELPASQYANQLALCCQHAAWQDNENMSMWIDECLVPHIQQRADGAPVVLFLNHFSCHYSDIVKAKFDSIGVQLKLIPKGCTSVVQPIDVGVNKPFKDRIKSQWWEWTIGFGQDGGNIPTPSREDVQHWVVEAWNSIGAHIIQNAWRKTDLSYFPEE